MNAEYAPALQEYLKVVPAEAHDSLLQLYHQILALLPKGEQVISYGILAFKLHGKAVVYCAGFKNHVSLYPAPTEHEDFKKDFNGYKTGKGTVQFPLNKALPTKLIKKIVLFRLKEVEEKLKAGKTFRTCSRGHQYYKTSNCPTCPVCEAQERKKENFLDHLSAPARRALQNSGIDSLPALATYSEKEILALHGVGKASLPILKKAMAGEGLTFRI